MMSGVVAAADSGRGPARRAASVASATDVGPRRVNEDRSCTALSDDDGAWVIAVADGLGGHPRGDEAAQAAVDGLPTRIASRQQMTDAFAAADERVLALSGAALRQGYTPLRMLPMSTLAVAAWTPEGGLLIAWTGDTLPFVATAAPDGSGAHGGYSRFGGYCAGRPHRNPDGSIDSCLGMPPEYEPRSAAHSGLEFAERPAEAPLPDAVILASDGAWEPMPRDYGVEWLWDDSPDSGIGSACGSDAATAADIAENVLSEARSLGLTDNATVAAALWH